MRRRPLPTMSRLSLIRLMIAAATVLVVSAICAEAIEASASPSPSPSASGVPFASPSPSVSPSALPTASMAPSSSASSLGAFVFAGFAIRFEQFF
ncbi:hypothetical protein pneo_cds_915 [Pandoravirus neocaledonia]|uniref:Uncharacterized protein n=1 Tax=Pandoravirus neocaledonia TaxID=2107708 RepID=A0A2U7UDN2_9VIRU|nr:hypothetical protein pneo_cds_915 [Pandoravirus neocaledonia]AVK76522.1 hypothetical protein pneo_cds_915 [Pandoravirus neocaledonia]